MPDLTNAKNSLEVSAAKEPAVEWGLFQKAKDSVVAIKSQWESHVAGEVVTTEQCGSGFVADNKGTIVTDLHVIAGAATITVAMSGKLFDAKIEKTDDANDLATIRALTSSSSSTQFAELKIASNSPTYNSKVYGFGFPDCGRQITISPGSMIGTIVRKDIKLDLSRVSMPEGENLTRTMLGLNMHLEGSSSGGPILNSSGEVVGVIGFSNFRSLGLATPSSAIKALLERK